MKYNIFISYPSTETSIVENFRSNFDRYGINAWVYSIDRTLAVDTWDEIKEKLREVDLVIFIISKDTSSANGQRRELKLVFEKIEPITGTSKIMPIFITGTNPSNAPEELRNKNGDFLDASNVKSLALKIAKTAFPSLVNEHTQKSWNYPTPGEWLEISNLDGIIEQYFEIGDKLYFRAISPMGLFECYVPKINDLFWISSENVKPSYDNEINKDLEKEIPNIFTVSGSVEIDQMGWQVWRERNLVSNATK